MEEFIRNYGFWMLLAAVLFALRGFGIGCCGGHRHRVQRDEGPAKPDEEKDPVRSRSGGKCH